MKKLMKMLAEKKVQSVDKDSDGIWVYLNWGRCLDFPNSGGHVVHEDTQEACLMALGATFPCNCKECTAALAKAKPAPAAPQDQTYTPGPWKIEPAFQPVHPVDGWIIKKDDDVSFPVCLVSETRGGLHSPQQANARLICAVTDLLSACQRIAFKDGKPRPIGSETAADRETLLAAIDKAKGVK